MHRKLLHLIAVSVFALSFLISPSVYAGTSSVTGRKIVIDPGHGGSDPGSTECAAKTESEANLEIALELESLLLADTAEVLLTRRDNETTLSNNDRYTKANQFDGEALVSIHLNGSTDHAKNGTMGLYGKKNKDEDFTRVLHSHLVNDLAPIPDEGVTNFASGVLLKSEMPASIQEAVYISNTNECGALTDGAGQRQQEIAQSLYNGLVDWFGQSDSGDDGGNGRKCETPPCGKNK